MSRFPDLMTTSEVADYLRLGERTVYDLVRRKRIPCSRVSGKLLFPRRLIDLWLEREVVLQGEPLREPPPIVAGSSDPLLEWALRESDSGLAVLTCGSGEGLQRLAAGEATAAALHLRDPRSGEYNLPVLREAEGLYDAVLLHWAWREQGLVVAPGNPLGLRTLQNLSDSSARLARRQEGAGAQQLLLQLLKEAGVRPETLRTLERPALTESDVATLVADGEADCGLAVASVARRFGLDFVPLARERFDLAVRRRSYFRPPFQSLLAFARTPAFAAKAAALGGYDVSELGRVLYDGV